MPHIPNHIVHCSLYLYASEEDANNAARSGGSGFLIHVPSPVKGYADKGVYQTDEPTETRQVFPFETCQLVPSA
jgi:hypothetical protein